MIKEIKFGDIIRDNRSGTEGVVYKIGKDGSPTADTAFDGNGKATAHSFSLSDKDLIHTDKVDIVEAIRRQCYYAVKNMERTVHQTKGEEYTQDQINDILFKNHLSNVKSIK